MKFYLLLVFIYIFEASDSKSSKNQQQQDDDYRSFSLLRGGSVELSKTSFCKDLSATVEPESILPFFIQVPPNLMKIKRDFKSYNIDRGETGVFDLRKPYLNKHFEPNFVSLENVNVKTNQDENKTIVIGVAGDWGAGHAEANVFTEFAEKYQFDWTFGLGDTYYVGSHEEVDTNLLGKPCSNGKRGVKWPSGKLGQFWTPGNHEAIGRFQGFYDNFMTYHNQTATFGVFQTDYYRIFILDPSYDSMPTNFSSIEEFIDYLPFWNGNPQVELNSEQKNWLENEKLGLLKDKSRGILLLQHFQLVSPFADEQLGPVPEMNEKDFFDASIGTTTKYFQKLLKRNGFQDNTTIIGVWGHDHKQCYMETTIPRNMTDQVSINLFGLLSGNGGYSPDSPDQKPFYENNYGVKYYDNETYKTIYGTPVGYIGFNVFKITGPTLEIEYFQSDPSKSPPQKKIVTITFQVNNKDGKIKRTSIKKFQ